MCCDVQVAKERLSEVVSQLKAAKEQQSKVGAVKSKFPCDSVFGPHHRACLDPDPVQCQSADGEQKQG